MKIAMIGHKVIPSQRGGIENVLTSLCPLLAELGAEITVYNRSSDKIEDNYLHEVRNGFYKGVRLKTAPTIKLRGISAMIASYTAALRASFSNADIVHFHAEGPCAALWIPKLFGKKCVATVHGLDWQREKWKRGPASKYIKTGEKVMAKYADKIIVLSESARTYFKDTYKRDTVLIPNGIDRPKHTAADKITKLFGLKKDEYICVVSRLTPEKGIHYLIDAQNSVKPDKKLVIAGDTGDSDSADSYTALLRKKAKDNPNIIFTGFISGDVLREIYSNTYAVCLPYDIEGMSLSLLEALAYGNALLCSDIPENTSVAKNHALYFKKSDTNDLAKKLKLLCSDSDFAKKLKKGADDFILSKYSRKDVALSHFKLYKSILDNRKYISLYVIPKKGNHKYGQFCFFFTESILRL